MDRTTIWQHIHAERRTLAGHLADLSPADWERDTLCAGWTVKDVAAHVIAHPQIGWAQLPGMLARNLGRGYNAMIFREVKRLSATQTPETILADFATYDGSDRRVPGTTTIEPLIDALVHTQDILRPLDRCHAMPPDAAAVAADRLRLLARLMGSRQLIRGVRMRATDVDWVRGTGPEVVGPMQELTMLCAGRPADLASLTGEGTVDLR